MLDIHPKAVFYSVLYLMPSPPSEFEKNLLLQRMCGSDVLRNGEGRGFVIGIRRAERAPPVDSWEGPLKTYRGERLSGEEAGRGSHPHPSTPLYIHTQKAAEIL